MNIKSITLTIAELTDILSITDETLRQQALEAVTAAAANPEKIDLNACLDGPSVILTLVHKVYRRYETAQLRAENRARKKAAPKKKQSIMDTATPIEIQVKFNEPIVRRLLWLKQHFVETVEHVTRALMAQDCDPFAGMLSESFGQLAELVKSYLQPLMKYASGYYRMPRGKRDGVVTIPVSLPSVA